MDSIDWNYLRIPPHVDGSTSWFKYEELIGDWLDLTVLEAGKRRPALKNRLIRDAAMCKGLLDPETLRLEGGVKYFKNTLRPPLRQRGSECFPLEIFSSDSCKERKTWRWSSGVENVHYFSSV